LGRELNKRGHPIKDPESEHRIAKSVGVSRGKLRSYPHLPIEIAPKADHDGKVVVSYKYTEGELLRAIEASSRKKSTGLDRS
jgi:hypothetical protein